jgi:gliding motility-associated lipoprotein GldH
MSRNIFIVFVLSLLVGGLFSCDSSRVYDTMHDLDSNAWNEKQELVYPVEISDPSASYKLYYTIRYNKDYPYYNLYINRVMLDSAGKFMSKKLQGMDLFKASTGVPYGNGIGSEKDYLIISEDKFKFPYAGKYTFKLKQYMRQPTISGISAVGIRVEKVQ